MTGKRPHTDSAGPFISRKYAADLLRSDVDSVGSFVEGHVRSTNPRKNLYTVDIRLDAKAKPAPLDVVIEDKLQRRMGELIVGDHLRISLQGARLLPLSDASSHVPVKLHFIEGVTILLVSRAGPQGEKEKLFHIWPGSNNSKGKRRKQAPNIDYSDVGWFSTPAAGDDHHGVEDDTFGMQAPAAPRRGRAKLTELQVSSFGLVASPVSAYSEMTNDAGPSTPVAAHSIPSGSTRSPLTTGQSRSATTAYAYKAVRRQKPNTPNHPTSAPESSSVVNSAVTPVPVRSTSKQSSDRTSVPLSRDSSEPASCGSTSGRNGPPPAKQKSVRRRKRDEAKRPVASATTVLTVSKEDSPTPTENVRVVTTTIGNRDICDPSPQDDGQVEINLDIPFPPPETQPEQTSVVQSGSEQTRSGEDETVPDQDDRALNMTAGLIVNGWPYAALSKLRNSALMSIIAVVSSTKEPKQTLKGDWNTCFSVLDPSVLDSFGGVLYTSGAGTKINCFMRLEQLLPNPKQGDVILLRQVKVQYWQDNLTGTCYAKTMQWAIYDPRTGKISQPDHNLARDRSHFPPSWSVVPEERVYCTQLVRWWAAVQRTRAERQGTAVQIGGGPVVASERKHVQRQHLLISEADPGREPMGYFNCTVEFLHGHANQVSDIYSIYVTDYSSKPGTSTEHSSEWCPASLVDRVLRIEMWRDEAVSLAQQMSSGEYWSLYNVRMKVSANGHIEGSFSEAAKARKLSIAEVDSNQHLRALLQRKKVWEENDANPHVFPHKLFSDAALQSIFDCTVEVLQAEYNPAGTSTLYITDYTERSDLGTPPIALWSRALPGRIVTLELQGPQSKMADKMEIGAFFTVKHMRLIERITAGGRVIGRIGGPDRLIHKLNANSPNEELEKLLERKKQWKEGATTTKPNDSFTTIARVLKSNKRVDKFRVRARVVGTFPLRLEDCVVRCCKGCSEQLPSGTDTCVLCINPDGRATESENVFHLFLRLQDERGDAQITVTVDQNSSILDGLTPDDAMNGSGTEVVRERLSGYIGNMEAVQAASSRGRTLEAKVPVREFTIESWYVEEGEDEPCGGRVVAYGLL